MSLVFADSACYLALLNPHDAFHSVAMEWTRSSRAPILVTEFVLLEIANTLSDRQHHELFGKFLADLARDPRTEVIPMSQELLNAGCEMFVGYADKDWSLTDCTSFVVMKQKRLTDALTADHHFQQAGFSALLLDAARERPT